MKKLLCLAVMLLLTGCAAGPRRSSALSAAELRARGWELEVSSEVPEPYYVLSGPGQSYKRFPLKAFLEAGLAENLARRPSLTGGGSVLRVHLAAVKTGFEEVGVPLSGGHDSMGGGPVGHPGLPVVTKRVELELRATIGAGAGAVTKPIRVEAVEVIDVAHYDPRWAYDYDGVVDEAVAKAARAIDAFVNAALRGGSGA